MFVRGEVVAVAGGLDAELAVGEFGSGEDFVAVLSDEIGDEGFEEVVHVEEEVEGVEVAVGEGGGEVCEEEAGEVEEGFVALVEAGDEGGGSVGGGEVGVQGDVGEGFAEFGEELAGGGGGGEGEEAFDDAAEDLVEAVVGGEFVEGAGEDVVAVGAAELVGDAEFAAEEGKVVVVADVVAVRGAVEFGAEVEGEDAGEQVEPDVGLGVECGVVVFEELEVEGVGEEDEEVAGGLGLALIFGAIGAVHFGEDLKGGVGEAEDADVVGGVEAGPIVVVADFQEVLVGIEFGEEVEVGWGGEEIDRGVFECGEHRGIVAEARFERWVCGIQDSALFRC
jgi:hypothetical protein